MLRGILAIKALFQIKHFNMDILPLLYLLICCAVIPISKGKQQFFPNNILVGSWETATCA